jgi:RNA polymerase sigma-70 factor (ECF subfamily)
VDGNQNVTQMLADWAGGDKRALDALMPIVNGELKRIAGAYLARERHAQTFQTTALVNEAYLRLVLVRPDSWESRARFFALAAQIMRRILVDHARAKLGPQRGGDLQQVSLDSALVITPGAPYGLMALDEALWSLEKLDARKGRVVELRLFGGLSHEETAEVLGISCKTVMRDWQFAKAWLARELGTGPSGRDSP